MVMLMADCGIRASEVCRLEWAYVDLDRRCLDVITKGGDWQHKLFSEQTAAFLKAWKVESLGFANGNDCVFMGIGGGNAGNPLTRNGLVDIFRGMGKRAGIKGLTPHVMRRTFATLALKKGANTRMVQLLGGWSRAEMVDQYSQALQVEEFDAYFPTNFLGGNDEL